jgi:hypothetical protein
MKDGETLERGGCLRHIEKEPRFQSAALADSIDRTAGPSGVDPGLAAVTGEAGARMSKVASYSRPSSAGASAASAVDIAGTWGLRRTADGLVTDQHGRLERRIRIYILIEREQDQDPLCASARYFRGAPAT